MVRAFLYGTVWILCLAALATAVRVGARPAASVQQAVVSPKPLAPPPRAGMRFPGWTVTRAYSAHHTMVVEVEAERMIDASTLAAQIVEPLKDRYDEILIYVREPDQRPDDLAARRVQWTPRGGYVESVYGR